MDSTASDDEHTADLEGRRLILFRVLLVAGSTLISLIIAEVVARTVIPETTTIRFRQDVDELQDLRLNEAAEMIENDPDLFWRLKPDIRIAEERWPFFGVVSNSQGLREAEEIPQEKPKGEIRILFLGDSCTFGYGVAHDQTFVEVCQSQLRSHLGSPVECINAGVPGYTLFQGHRRLLSQGLALQPDLVVLNFGWNDYGQWDHLGDREHHAAMQAMIPPGPLKHSKLCELAWRILNKPRGKGEDTRPRVLPDEFEQLLEETHTLLKKEDIPMLVLVWPLLVNATPEASEGGRTELQAVMSRFAQDHPLSTQPRVAGFIDLIPVSRQIVREHGANTIYYDPGHVNATAHQAFGSAIARHLAPWLTPQ